MEENPWDVFESIFEVNSLHEGTIIELSDKGAVIALPYGVEGFATPKHLIKQDGTQAKLDEKIDVKVIDFSKSSKKIIVSHSRIFEDDQKAKVEGAKKSVETTVKKTQRKIKQNLEKTTLGDITDLAALKTEMEEKAKKNAKNAEDND